MSFRFVQLSLCALLLSCYGCVDSGNVGTVEGVVTVDGVPADRATIQFHPTGPGRTSIGYTDENGHYRLVYTKDEKGALIGEHKVTISTELEEDHLYGADTEERAETMPAKYLDENKTDLTANVEKGNNEIDFELKSADF